MRVFTTYDARWFPTSPSCECMRRLARAPLHGDVPVAPVCSCWPVCCQIWRVCAVAGLNASRFNVIVDGGLRRYHGYVDDDSSKMFYLRMSVAVWPREVPCIPCPTCVARGYKFC